ncbi:hypothetical protein CPC08DRAFT_816568 [Agrocybe pediades]|nr:hypothetical protein CPC08DRAFT_816568 [Agrocybe pediades]
MPSVQREHPFALSQKSIRLNGQRPEIYEDDFLEKVHLRNEFKIDEQTNFKILASQRDETRCLITNTTGAAQDVSWIVPPAFMRQRDYYQSEGYKTYKDVRMLSNCITMRKELVTPFLENAFGIDVDDDFRIIIFGNVDETTRNLLEDAKYADGLRQACASGREDVPKRCFLLAHFRWCLCSHFLGGDIKEEYGDLNKILAVMEQGEKAADDAQFWDTIPGREYRAFQEIFQ